MTTLNTPTPKTNHDLPGMQQKLRDRLAKLGGRIRAQIAFDALVRGLAVLIGLLTLSLLLDFWLELSRPVRVLYWLATLAAGAHFLYHYGFKPLRNKLGPVELAEAVDIAQGHTGVNQIAPRVATVLQLPGMIGDDQSLSSQMINDAVGRSYGSLDGENFNTVINNKHKLQCVGALLATLLVPGIVGGVMNSVGENVIGTWAQRWLMLADTPYPRNTTIAVLGLEDSVLTIPAGENATLRATITTKDGREIKDARIVIEPDDGDTITEALTFHGGDEYRLDLSPMNKPGRATITSGDQTLRFKIQPAARPRLTGLKLHYTHPKDPGNKQTIDFNGVEGEVSLLERNEIELVLTANVPIAQARYVIAENKSADEQPEMPPIVKAGPNSYTISWTHDRDMRFRIELISEGAGLVSQPIPISVGEKIDQKPKVRLRHKGLGPRITKNALIPLTIEGRDDLGLTELGISVQRIRIGSDASDKTFDPITQFKDDTAAPKEVRDKLEMEVDQFGLRPTDVLRLTGVATDNRFLDPQTGEALVITFNIVTDKELFREIITRQQSARSSFRQAIEDSKDVKAALVAAENGGQAAAQLRPFGLTMRGVQKVSGELERSAEEMRLNRLGGDKEDGNQAYESMKIKILAPLRKLHSDRMVKQRSALENTGGIGPEGLKKLVDDQQAVIDEMNRLLTSMNDWDEMLDALNQLNEVIDGQDELLKKIEEMIKKNSENIFD